MKQKYIGRDVGDVREVEPAPAGAAAQFVGRNRTDTFLPCVVENPRPLGIDPQIEVLRHHVAHGFGTVAGVAHLVGEVVGRERDAEVGVRLYPHARIVPLLVRVERIYDAEQRIVLVHLTQYFNHVLAVGITGARLVESGCGDDEHQRLATRAEGRLDDVEHPAVAVGVEFVDDAARGIQTIVRAVVRRQGLHHAAARLINNRVAEWREVVLEVGSTDDLDGISKAYFRLIFDRGGRIDLGARLAVGEEHVEPHAGR